MRITVISLLAICLLAPSLTEAHQANPWVAGLITPVWYLTSFTVLTFTTAQEPGLNAFDAGVFTVPGVGYLYAGCKKEFFATFIIWAVYATDMILAYYHGFSVTAGLSYYAVLAAALLEVRNAPELAKKHNEKHAKEKTGASSHAMFPVLTVSAKGSYVGVRVCF